jgi:hypothetical protein
MKTFNDLSEEQKVKAIDKQYTRILKGILEYGIRFDDKLNEDDTQKRIDKAIKKADAKQTPWFASEYIEDDKVLVERLRGMAQCDAEDALYSEPDEYVVDGIL